MASTRLPWLRAEFASAVAAVTLSVVVTGMLIAVLSDFRAEAAPQTPPSDLALFDAGRGMWHLRYGDGTVESFYFGVPGDIPLLGDWDCDGIDTVALFRESDGFVYLRNDNRFGVAEQSFYYGTAGDVPVAGDWDGDGCDSLGVQRNGEFFLADELGTVVANSQFHYGVASDIPFAGDFDGDGRDTIGLHRPAAGRAYLTNVNLDGQVPETAHRFFFGLGTDRMLGGDWDGDGDDSVGVYRPSANRFHLAFENADSGSDERVDLGRGDPVPLAGRFGPSPSADSAVLIGAGDIGRCDSEADEATALLLDARPGTIFTTGDNAYPDGTAAQFAECFDPAWGRHRDRMRPTPGNHDYHTPGAAGYYEYFGSRAADPSAGWYSYDIGGWHIVALNSNCSRVGGCGPGSPQHTWLVADLAASPAACTLAYWHHPRWNAGYHAGSGEVGPLWDALYAAGADVVLAGHDHSYQRWTRQDPSGQADPDGIRQFVVGSGGAPPYAQSETPGTLEVFWAGHGVLELALDPAGYSWEFLPVAGEVFTDSGAETCR